MPRSARPLPSQIGRTETAGVDVTPRTSTRPTRRVQGQKAADPAKQVRATWCAEHVRQLGGESPLPNLMEVKG
jgi:hypothetical protein